jgi:dUTP pyrophosphatase
LKERGSFLMNDIKIYFKKLKSGAKIPTYAKNGDACCDLYAVEDYTIKPGEVRLIGFGFAIEMPPGFEAQVRPRSGLAVKYALSIVNSPGTIDNDYRGEIMTPIINLGKEPYTIKAGDRVAQMKFSPIYTGHFLDVGDEELSITERGANGMGSTGKN